METRKCSNCSEEKPLINTYYPSFKSKSGEKRFRSYCKVCLSIRAKTYYEKNVEEITIRSKKYRTENRELVAAQSRKSDRKHAERRKLHRQNNRDEICKRQREYYAKNAERLKSLSREYRKKHNEYRKEWDRQYYLNNKERIKERSRNNPAIRIANALRSRVRGALKGTGKSDSTMNLVGCDISFLKKHLEDQFTKGMGWENHGFYGWHIDHIRPCASFDLTDPEQQKQCFHYTNLQPLWAKDNLSKGDTYDPIGL